MQVLSTTMAKAIKIENLHYTHSTVKFISMFDRVFDCLNVSKFNQDSKGKRELAPYRNVDDWRFHVSYLLKL